MKPSLVQWHTGIHFRSLITLSSHLILGLPSVLLPTGFQSYSLSVSDYPLLLCGLVKLFLVILYNLLCFDYLLDGLFSYPATICFPISSKYSPDNPPLKYCQLFFDDFLRKPVSLLHVTTGLIWNLHNLNFES